MEKYYEGDNYYKKMYEPSYSSNVNNTYADVKNRIITDIIPENMAAEKQEINCNGLSRLKKYISITGITQNFEESLQEKENKSPYHEKSSNTIRLLLEQDKINELSYFCPQFVKLYNSQSHREDSLKIVSNSILMAMPTPLTTYSISLPGHDNASSMTMDLTKLKTEDGREVETMRLDKFLRSIGFEDKFSISGFNDIHSYADLERFMNNEYVQKLLTPRAIVQVALSSYFIPNTVGELDANSRNVILAKCNTGKYLDDLKTTQYDTVFRIDAEANTFVSDILNTRSGLKAVPKGIYEPDEPQATFFTNISINNSGIQDWGLFKEFLLLTQEFCRRSFLDNQITDLALKTSSYAYLEKCRKNEKEPAHGMLSDYYSLDSYAKFIDETIGRSKRFLDNVLNYLPSCSSKKLGETDYGKKPNRLKPRLFNEDMEEIQMQ